MAQFRRRRSLAFLAVGLVVFAALVPAVAASLPVAILTALWLIPSPVVSTTLCRAASRCDEQPASLLSLVASRAPPVSPTLA